MPTPIGSREFASDVQITTQDDVPTLRDHINVAKNLLELLAGARPSTTGLVAWSRSGDLALGMEVALLGYFDRGILLDPDC